MANFALGFRILFRVWSDNEFAQKVRDLADGKPAVPQEAKPAPRASAPSPAPAPLPAAAVAAPRPSSVRNDAVSLLALLQREARFVDFIKEPIAAYSNEQIGAAVRDVHKGCAAVLDRVFEVRALSEAGEGASIEVPKGFDAARFKLTGNVAGEPPFRGTLQHHGWKATRCELPQWTGGENSALVIAPAEVEVK